MQMTRIAQTILLAVLTALALPCEAGERWYVLEMQGQRAGWTVEREHTKDGTIISTTESRLTIRRGTTDVTLAMSSRFVEAETGEPIEMTAKSELGGTPTEDHWIFGPDNVRWISTSGAQRIEKSLPNPEGSWLPPAAAGRFTAARLAADAERIIVRTIDPLNGLEPIVTTRSGFSREIIEVLGRDIEAIRCRSESSIYPDSVGTEFISDDGTLLRSELSMGAMKIAVIAADEQLAKSDLDPPEMMASLFISPDRRIRNAYSKSSGTYVLRATSGALPDIPTAGSQTAERIDDASVRVTRSLEHTSTPAPASDLDNPAFTESSTMVTAADPRVIELATAALSGSPDSVPTRAEDLRRAAHRHIRSKDLSVGFASAAETARTREGDCTEHAVLLAAMLRAEGIPSRVVSGLIYADRFAGGKDIFGYHMWTQALLPIDERNPDAGSRWVDLDATLPEARPLTATHIALGTHALAGDSRANALVELAPLMGRLAIEVESTK